jgi:polysaccharide biosynthesis transport protein
MTTGDRKHGALEDFLTVVRRYKWFVIVATLVVPLTAFVYSTTQKKVFRATSEVLLDQKDLGAALTGIVNPADNIDPERYARTQAALASVSLVAERALKLAGEHAMTPTDLLKTSDVSPRVDADLLTFTVDAENEQKAARLSTAYASAFTNYKLTRDTEALQRARAELEIRLSDIRKQGGSDSQLYADLVEKVQDLRTLELLQARASVVRPASTADQVQPRPLRNAALGLFLGLLLGLGAAFFRNVFDRGIRSEEEVEEGLGLPLLARLPKYSSKVRGRPPLVMLSEPTHVAAEAIRRLRTNLELAAMSSAAKSILITSAAATEGKSTTAANLSVALARSGHRVALVDLDLRQPSVASMFGIGNGPGVADVVLGLADLRSAMNEIPLSPLRSVSGSGSTAGHLRVLGAGATTPDPGEFVSSQKLADLLETLKRENDFVLIDGPPILSVGDAISLSTFVDAMIAVVRLDVTERPMLRDLSRALAGCPCPKLGFVLTNTDARAAYGAAYMTRQGNAEAPLDVVPDAQRAPARK